MKYHSYNLIIGLSIILLCSVNGSGFGEEFLSTSTVTADSDMKIDKTTESSNAVNIPKDDLSALRERLGKLEDESAAYAEMNERFENLQEEYKKLEGKYEELLNKESSSSIKKEKNISNKKKKSKKKKGMILSDPAIKEYLDEYYVDVELDVGKAEEKTGKTINGIQEDQEKKPADDIVDYVNKSIEENPSPEFGENMHQALKELHKAQKSYYAGRYGYALKKVSSSLSYQETAFGYALEGSILFTMGETNSAIDAWETALELDPGMYEVRDAIYRYKR